MKTPHYKAKYSRSTSRGWHKALSLVLLLTILAGSFPAGGFTALADEVPDADSMIQQEGAQAEGEGAQLLQAPAPDEAVPESIPYESGTDQSGTDESGTDESGTVQPEADQSGTDQLEADESGTDQSGTDQSGTVSQSEQPTEEPAAEPAEEPAGPAAEPTAEPAEAQDEPDEIPAEEETVYANSVSGALWLDILEDENSGAQHGDGIRQAGEEPVPDYDVSLYKADDKDTAVQTVKTDSDGQYIFENIEPGTYVVGISTCEKDGVEYLLPIVGLPIIGMSDDTQQFSDYNDAYTTVYSKPIVMEADTVVTDINAGLRTPMGVQPAANVAIQPSKSDLYVRNETKIGFGGKQWWVIGDSGTSTPASLRAPGAGSVTLLSDRSANFGTSVFNSYTGAAGNNNYNGSVLQSAMTNAYNNILTAKEKTYVVPRPSIDLQSWPNANAYNYANPINQNFWPLSAYEYEDMGSFGNASINAIRGISTYAWLRSPGSPYVHYCLVGAPAGSGIDYTSVNTSTHSVRPAFYFDISDALFTSDASGAGMKATAFGPGLNAAVTPAANTPVKLTMEESNSSYLNLALNDTSLSKVTAPPKGTVSIDYNSARTGAGKSVSVMICNKDDAAVDPGKVLYYGRPVNCQSGNASGTATFTLPSKSDLPIGDYTLKIFNEEVNGANRTDYASTPIEIGLRVADVEVDLSSSPATQVYYTDTTPGSVNITADITNHTAIAGTTIEPAQWLRTAINSTTDYSDPAAFDAAYSGAASANKGTLTETSNDGLTATYQNLMADKNANYWVKGTVYDSAAGQYYKTVSVITVDNLYKEITCEVRGMNTVGNNQLYGYETIPGTYGIPFDLDGTRLAAAPSLGFDTIDLSAKTPYIKYGPAKTKSNQPLANATSTATVTLDGTINADCDGDYTKYTVFYTLQKYLVDKDTSGTAIGTYSTLQAAVNACVNTEPCTITATADDTAMGNMVTIPSGKSITLTSASSNAIRSITQTLSTRHLDVIGKLTLKNIVLKGVGKQTDSSGTVNGGIAVSTGGQLRMEAGAEITKCYTNVTSGAGGAGVNVNGGAFTMTGGKITNNVTPNDGGGVYMLSSTAFVMSGGEISGNKAARGGGVYLFGNGFFIKNGGDITGNTATGHGGGVAMAQGTFISNSGNISGNHANGNGGGVYMSIAQGTFTMGGGTLSGNTAGGDGGAIYTPDYDYDNPADTSKYSRISVSASAVISGNTASGGVFAPPVNHQAFSTRAVKPFPGTLLDNNNINYRGNKYAIAYRVNNTTNTPDAYQATNIATGSSGTATLYTQTQAGFNAASAIEPGKEKFIGWNTQADGNGTPYTSGQTNVPVNGNLTLYAQWDHYRYIVTNDTSNDCLGSYDQLSAAVNACLTTDPCTITATSDDTSVNVVVTIPANKQITLTSDGTRHTVTQSSLHALGRHFEVNGSLTLKSIILMGRGLTSGGPISVVNGGIQVNNGGTLMMENDAQITQCFAANRGGGVLLDDGTFTMNGGEISGNVADSIGGGVFALGNAVFNLNDGEISENTSWGNGAGVMLLDTGVRFTMTGGEISGNTSGANGGGVIALRDALFTMSGGKITGNTASKSGGGVSATNFVMVDGEISGNTATDYGGGVYSTGTFTMHDGVITDNEAVKGGGVYGSNNTFAFTMLDGKIYENTATGTNSSDGGGGVGMTNGSFTMKGGEITGNTVASGLMSLGRGGGVCTDGSNAALKLEAGEISGNTAPYGGGVAIVGINATFTMTNGEITGNHANGNWVDTGDGGGVLVAKPSNLVMQGGEISGNTSTGEGGGVHTMSYSYSNPAATTGNNSYENISIASAATVSGNTAGERFSPPSNYPQFTNRATNSFNGLLLDNDNINYRNPNYAVTYDANNSTNTPDAIQATNINTGNSGNVILYTQTQAGFNAASAIEPGKEVFLGWNTQADGNGTHYDVGQTITISGNLTLFAEWDHYRYIVSKDSDSSVIGSYDKLDDAVNACPVSVPCTITATSDDPTQSGGTTANMVMRQVITLTSDNTTRTIKQPGGAHIVLSKRGTLTLKNIILEGPGIDSSSPTRRGGVTTGGTLTDPGGTLIMDAGSVITKCYGKKGGGVEIGNGGSFTMNGDAKIVNNIAGYGGGGVYLNTSMGGTPFTMNDNATISDNVSNRGGGGGVHVLESSMTMNGGKITGNTSRAVEGNIAGQGGGVYFDAGSGYSFMMYAGEISDNRAMASSQQRDTVRGSGGGIYYYFPPFPDGNPVTNVANCYAVMHISSNATVEHNTADLGSAFPPNNYLDFNDPAIRGVYTFDGSLLDNDNINYRNPNYMVTYDANNGGVGDFQKYYQSTNVSTGSTTVNAVNVGTAVIGEANFTPPTASHVFAGWTENADGTGTLYHPGDPITLTGSKTLYAKWVPFVDVTLSKTVTGAMGDKTRGFTFKITFEDSTGTKLPSGTQLDYTGSVLSGTTGVTAPASGTLTLDNTGSDTITLKHGQSIKIEDVQVNYKIIIEETDGTGYTVKYTDSANPSSPQTSATTGPKTLSGDRTFAFENNRGGSTPGGFDLNSTGLALLIGIGVILIGGGLFIKRASRRVYKERH